MTKPISRKTYEIKKWSRKGQCPICRVSTGSYHSVYCSWYSDNKEFLKRPMTKPISEKTGGLEKEFGEKVKLFILGIVAQYGKPVSQLSEIEQHLIQQDIENITNALLQKVEREVATQKKLDRGELEREIEENLVDAKLVAIPEGKYKDGYLMGMSDALEIIKDKGAKL